MPAANILLIEDDKLLRDTLCGFLKDQGYRVECASGQSEGLRAFSQGNFDCILLDISLFDGDGFTVCTEVRKTSEIPVIFLTASADEACIVAGFKLGANDYVCKPFRPLELRARIENALRRSPPPALVRCQDIAFDLARGTVTKNGQEIYLSALEYRLMLKFLRNQNLLITRNDIAEELWTYSGEFVSDNTLNVYIKRLRDKIEDDPAHPKLLKTVRGLGYRLESR